MPKTVVTVDFTANTANAYVPDYGGVGITTNGRFILPPDIDASEIPNIVAATGGELLTERPPCNDLTTGNLRRLVFVRRSGNTMSVPIGLNGAVLGAATTIKAILDAGNGGGNPVVCIKLEGEYFANLNDVFSLSYTEGSFAKTHKADSTAEKQYIHAGRIAYQADYLTGATASVFQSVKAITDVEGAPATQVASEWIGCVGEFENVQTCGNGRRNPLEHRRFILNFLTKTQEVADPANPPAGIEATALSEQIEIPVQAKAAGSINTCGVALASLTGVYCIGYRGESYDRIHQAI